MKKLFFTLILIFSSIMVVGATSAIKIFIFLLFLVIIANFFKNYGNKCSFGKTGNKVRKDVPYFRDIPCDKDVFYAYWVAYNYNLIDKKEDFFGAVLLKWIYKGNVKLKKVTKDGIFNDRELINIYFIKRPMNIPELEMEVKLYDYMYAASFNGKLEQNEFKEWCINNYQMIFRWFDECLYKETLKLVDKGKITYKKGKSYNLYKCFEVNSSMMEIAEQMAGLKKYLQQFSNIDSKELIEIGLLNEYLIYAQIFGIADKIDNQFKKLYPEVIKDVDDFSNIVFIRSIF